MTDSFDLTSMPRTAPSICIPRVFANITGKYVQGVFEDMNLGKVERVDMVLKKNDKGESFKRVFIHFKYWNNDSSKVRQRLLQGNTIKVVYDSSKPWFWKCSASRVPRPSNRDTHAPHAPSHEEPNVSEVDQLREEVEQLRAALKAKNVPTKRKVGSSFSETRHPNTPSGENVNKDCLNEEEGQHLSDQ